MTTFAFLMAVHAILLGTDLMDIQVNKFSWKLSYTIKTVVTRFRLGLESLQYNSINL